MNHAQPDAVLARLKRLETELLRWRLAAVAGFAVLAATFLTAMGSKPAAQMVRSEEIRTGKLVIVDGMGVERARLAVKPDGSWVTFDLLNKAGESRTRLVAGEVGGAGLILKDREGTPRGNLVIRENDNEALLELVAADGMQRTRVAGSAGVALVHEETTRIALETTKWGGSLAISDSRGRTRATLDAGTGLSIHDGGARTRVAARIGSNNEPTVEIRDPKGEVVWQAF